MVDKNKIKDRLQQIIQKMLGITIQDYDENFFSTNINVSPVNMVYLLLEMEKEFPVVINDKFIENLPCITVNRLTEAILSCSE